MSMTMLTALQLTGVTISYFFTTLILPWLFFRKRLNCFSLPVRFMSYYVIGNFYIISLVLLLQLIRFSNRITLIIGTLFPFLILFYLRNKGHIFDMFEKILTLFRRILERDLTAKTLFDLFKRKRKVNKRKISLSKKNLLFIYEAVLVIAVLILIFCVYGLNLFDSYGYKASDVLVHNKWINEMNNNNIFSSGVYPFGFHCMIYYLHTVYGIKTMTLLRLFSLSQTIMVHLMLLVFMKGICKSRYMPYLTVIAYTAFSIFNSASYTRFNSTLPQEYGMIFILPSIYYLIAFFRQFYKEQKSQEGTEKDNKTTEKKRILKKFRSIINLIIRKIHSLKEHKAQKDTEKDKKTAEKNRILKKFRSIINLIIRKIHSLKEQKAEKKHILKRIKAGIRKKYPQYDWYLALFAISISLTFTIHFYNTMIAGIFCIGVAVGFIVLLKQKKYLKRIIIAGISGIAIAVLPMAVGYAEGKGLQGSLYWGMSIISGDSADAESDNTEAYKEAEEALADNSFILKRISIHIAGYLFIWDDSLEFYKVWILLFSVASLFFLGIAYIKLKEKDYGMILISIGTYIVLMLILLSSSVLGIPSLMDPIRTIIYLAYSTVAAVGLFLDAAIYYLLQFFKKTQYINITSLGLSAAAICIAAGTDSMKPFITQNTEFNTNEAIICTENILHDNKGRDYTWTIVSANDELQMTQEHGRHYETITFLRDIRDQKKDSERTIPTETVYFYIEKIPINYAGKGGGNKIVSEEGASMPLYGSSSLGAYTGTNRWITMSHMYFWAQEFQKMYPNEMEVYYETDNFICYRVQQNPYSFYNFSIDYGYNNPESSEPNDKE